MKIKDAVFVISNSELSKCPTDAKPEFAFIGRSNVGKSSLINMLTGKKSLAKTSGTPGKTQLINHFLIDEKWYLVDLPGFGYAKASKSKRFSFAALRYSKALPIILIFNKNREFTPIFQASFLLYSLQN